MPRTRLVAFLRRWWWVAALAAIAIITATVSFAVLAGQDWEYDEAAHRRVNEAVDGTMTDAQWSAYRDGWLDLCATSDDLAVDSTDYLFDRNMGEFELNVLYACGDRVDEIPAEWRVLD